MHLSCDSRAREHLFPSKITADERSGREWEVRETQSWVMPRIRAGADCTAGSTRAGLSALILGATGATGKVLLQELLASPSYSSVSEYGRHVTEQEKLVAGKEKLEQKVIDFERLEEAGLKDGKWDVVFITCVFLQWL